MEQERIDNGWTVAELAKHKGLDYGSMRVWRREAGFQPLKPGRRKKNPLE
jgi:hypothetical protein